MYSIFCRRMFLATMLSLLTINAHAFELLSPDIGRGGKLSDEQVLNEFGCNGRNVSPVLSWSNAPKETRSFALFVHDPDAPTGGPGWTHWIVVNIPATSKALAKNAGAVGSAHAPAGAYQVPNDFGKPAWSGPCPPRSDAPHRYVFTLYALRVETIPVQDSATPALIGYLLESNKLGVARLTARYGRPR